MAQPPTAAAAEQPVSVVFDPARKPADLLSGRPVPLRDRIQVQADSVQFYLHRLNQPLDYLTYFKEGRTDVPVARLARIIKVQEPWGIWRLYYRGHGDAWPITQNVRSTAVSFVPLQPDGAPGARVHVLLDDLLEIYWGR